MELYTFRIDERLLLIFNLQMSHHPLDFVPCMDIFTGQLFVFVHT